MSIKDEIDIIMNVNVDTNKYLNSLIQKNKKDLIDFIYVDNINTIIGKHSIFIRYISTKGRLFYGGILYKVIKENDIFYLLLVNKNKTVWKISFNDNFIFYKTINTISDNENKRNAFLSFLEKYDK